MMGSVEMPRTDSHRDGARRRPRPLSPLRRLLAPADHLLTRRLHIDLLRICSASSPAV
ncbi:hypothetical protein SMF913_26530 [Streptomyces malaysiensis]|uniref:Uncharacterized protein n=1 Tax=Streptomyces malaysiensis TaxID=92644 RepID=A0A2J7YSQ2_STRMQ|nr:hypothetical protein SMF913_26530 [Streptomyces malaysiensis]